MYLNRHEFTGIVTENKWYGFRGYNAQFDQPS